MKVVNIHEVKTQLSRYLKEVESGKEVIIGKYGVPVARLVPYLGAKPSYRFGLLKGKITFVVDFDAPDTRPLSSFEGRG